MNMIQYLGVYCWSHPIRLQTEVKFIRNIESKLDSTMLHLPLSINWIHRSVTDLEILDIENQEIQARENIPFPPISSMNAIGFFLVDRYQFFLQLKQDLLSGRLTCNFETCVELAALALQCKCYGFPRTHLHENLDR